MPYIRRQTVVNCSSRFFRSGELARIKSQPLHVTLDDDSDTFTGKTFGQNLVVPVHHPKDGSLSNCPRGTPSVECPERTTRLIGARRNADPSSLPFLVLDLWIVTTPENHSREILIQILMFTRKHSSECGMTNVRYSEVMGYRFQRRLFSSSGLIHVSRNLYSIQSDRKIQSGDLALEMPLP